jgi:ABC-type amino acid transport substrate-binding protein|tara:strand:+ start:236 stop:415 length:180 start_codon:yes stop_codon:yes gene_type:complete
MGRKRKYISEEERREAQRKWSMEYYHRNRVVLQAKARERYRRKKQMELKEIQRRELYGE